jgi:hypothetical protein
VAYDVEVMKFQTKKTAFVDYAYSLICDDDDDKELLHLSF